MSVIYLRRQQERGLMQKARRLMDENSVSFQMFLFSCLRLHLVQKGKFLCSNNVRAILRSLGFFSVLGEHAQKPKKKRLAW